METDERTTAESYSAGAPAYARYWAPLLSPRHRRLMERLSVPDATRLLDVGTGVGSLLPLLAATAPGALVVGLDAAPGMLCLAAASFPVVAAHAGALPFPDAAFDGAVCAFVLFHLADPERALVEMHRVLRSGGRLALGTWAGDPSEFPANAVWRSVLDEAGAAPADDARSQHVLDSAAAVHAMVQRSGFVDTESTFDDSEDRMTVDEFLERRTALGASRRRFESLAPATRDEVLAEARRRLTSLPPDGLVSRERAILTWARAS